MSVVAPKTRQVGKSLVTGIEGRELSAIVKLAEACAELGHKLRCVEIERECFPSTDVVLYASGSSVVVKIRGRK